MSFFALVGACRVASAGHIAHLPAPRRSRDDDVSVAPGDRWEEGALDRIELQERPNSARDAIRAGKTLSIQLRSLFRETLLTCTAVEV